MNSKRKFGYLCLFYVILFAQEEAEINKTCSLQVTLLTYLLQIKIRNRNLFRNQILIGAPSLKDEVHT